MAESSNFDIIQVLLANFSGDWTGANISREIFSYLDFATLMQVRSVCKIWNDFLTNERFLWLKFLKRTKPYLEHLSVRFLPDENHPDVSKNLKKWNGFFDNCEKSDLKFRQIVNIFRQIQCIYAVAEDKWKCYFHFHYSKKFSVCYDSEVFQDSFIGDKLTENIQRSIKLRKNAFLKDLAEVVFNFSRHQQQKEKIETELVVCQRDLDIIHTIINEENRNSYDAQILQDLQNQKRSLMNNLKIENQIEEDRLRSLSQDLNVKLQKELFMTRDNKG